MLYSLRIALILMAMLGAGLLSNSVATFAGPALTRGQTPDDKLSHPTSRPYDGDLSIFEYPDRDKKLQIDRVMDILKIKPGSSVADIGAGSGWFTVRAARRVGAAGSVSAVEINQSYLDYIAGRARAEGFANIKTVLGKPDDPNLGPNSIDAVLILKSYHEIAQPVRLLINLRKAMRDGALLGIIDRNGLGNDHGLKRSIVVEEATRAGFALVDTYDFVKPDGMDYFLVFKLDAPKM